MSTTLGAEKIFFGRAAVADHHIRRRGDGVRESCQFVALSAPWGRLGRYYTRAIAYTAYAAASIIFGRLLSATETIATLAWGDRSLIARRSQRTARCPRMLPGPRTCYRTSRAQKTRRVLVRGSGSTMNRHTHIAATKTRRAENEGRGRHTHTTDTLQRCALRGDGARARDGARPTQFERVDGVNAAHTVSDCDLPSRPLSPFWPQRSAAPRVKLCYRRWRLDWARASRVCALPRVNYQTRSPPALMVQRATGTTSTAALSETTPQASPSPVLLPVVRALPA